MQDYYVAKNKLLAGIIPKGAYVGYDKNKKTNQIVNVSLLMSVGKTLGEDLFVRVDSPAFDNSAMDGYALCDPQGDLIRFEMIGRITAGDDAVGIILQPGQACRIFTGASIPEGATAVVMQESTQLMDAVLTLEKPIRVGLNIRLRAEELSVGQTLATKGTHIDPAMIALLASQGYAEVPIIHSSVSALKVAVFSTGNELVDPPAPLATGKIYDANRYQLLAWLSLLNVNATDGKILPDSLVDTENALLAMSQHHDVIILSGGASVGEEDHVKPALESIGTLEAWKLLIKPGKPFGWGKILKKSAPTAGTKEATYCHVFLLPGNPVAAYVTFYLLIYPALLKMQGSDPSLPQRVVIADFETKKLEPRREYKRGKLISNAESIEKVQELSGQGSAMLAALCAADVLIEIPPNSVIKKGDYVNVIILPK